MTTPTGSPPLQSPHALPAGSPLPRHPVSTTGMSLPNHLPVGAGNPAPFPAQARTVPTPFSQSPTFTTIPGNPAALSPSFADEFSLTACRHPPNPWRTADS